jgi:predicted hydrocarbon binding protein
VTIEDVMGSNGVAAVLRLAKLAHLIGNYPADTLDREFSFQDFAAVNQAIEEMYGAQGAKGLCFRAGGVTVKYAIEDGALFADLRHPAFELLAPGAKVKVGLNILATTFGELSDQIARAQEDGDNLIFAVEQCPECWGRASESPICYGTAGMLHEALHWLSDSRRFTVDEIACIARGDESCTFVIVTRVNEESEDQGLTGPAENSAGD